MPTFKTSCLKPLLLCLALAPIPAQVVQAAEVVQVAALAPDDLGLYFDQAELTMVESASHAPKPITQVAENVTIITARDIERWNAHSLQEVLVRVPGLMVSFNGREVANPASLHIQGSEYEEVQVFVDGLRWNDVSSDYNLTNQIPVGIIEQVEVIKGPASSTWGSAFGGVVNVITKGAGTSRQPAGTVTASYGRQATVGTAAEVKGLAGPLGYYLHGGLLNSDGLEQERWLESDSLYAKVAIPLPAASNLSLALLHTNPEYQNIRSAETDFGTRWNEEIRYATASFNRPLGQGFQMLLAGSLMTKHYDDYRYALLSQEPSWDYQQDSRSRSGSLRVYGDRGRHSLSLGAETSRNAYDEYEAVWVQHWGYRIPEETWGLYANDTIHLGRATLTPGLRYDSISIADSQLSPSLGLTCRLNDFNLLRASVARGFRRPVPMLKNPNPDFFSVSNPLLESETVTSSQLGLESTAVKFLLLKATLFHHDADHTWRLDPDSWAWVNGDGSVRDGVELTLETERWQGLAIQANHSWVDTDPDTDPDPGHTSLTNLVFDYQGPWGGSALLAGHHVWFNDNDAMADHQDTAMIWDATATKALALDSRYRLDLFASAHNLFNGSQTFMAANPNAGRWLEAGLRLHF